MKKEIMKEVSDRPGGQEETTPGTMEWFKKARRGPLIKIPDNKAKVSVIIDKELYDWFMKEISVSGGKGFDEIVNDLLKKKRNEEGLAKFIGYTLKHYDEMLKEHFKKHKICFLRPEQNTDVRQEYAWRGLYLNKGKSSGKVYHEMTTCHDWMEKIKDDPQMMIRMLEMLYMLDKGKGSNEEEYNKFAFAGKNDRNIFVKK